MFVTPFNDGRLRVYDGFWMIIKNAMSSCDEETDGIFFLKGSQDLAFYFTLPFTSIGGAWQLSEATLSGV